jgi:UDP-N-acetylmuramyl pentapeptide synthase
LGLSLSVFQIEQFNPDIKSFLLTLKTIITKLLFGKKPYDVLILEYGIDRPGEMDFLLGIAKPHIGVFTAIDSVHSEQF